MMVCNCMAWVRWTALAVGGVVVASLLVLVGYGMLLSASLTLPKSDDHPPLLIYGAPFQLRPGLPLAESGLLDRLHRLGYRSVEAVQARVTAARPMAITRRTPAGKIASAGARARASFRARCRRDVAACPAT